MRMPHKTYCLVITTLLLCLMQAVDGLIHAQERPRAALKREHAAQVETASDSASLALQADTIAPVHAFGTGDSLVVTAQADSIAAENKRKLLELTAVPTTGATEMPVDTLLQSQLYRKMWVPNPTKATWLALVIPGGGQIYNRKYWKLPIFYGGFAGCAYALTWNGKMYDDYFDAYREAANGNWNSSAVTDLLPPGYLDRVSQPQVLETLRKGKDRYRRWRDMSIFAFAAVYLLSVVDAYVDAELSNFDITPDLSMKVEPAVMDVKMEGFSAKTSVGVQCSLCF